MVRLLLDIPYQIINTREGGFNPTMVRLLPETTQQSHEGTDVSIPQWCDCCSA